MVHAARPHVQSSPRSSLSLSFTHTSPTPKPQTALAASDTLYCYDFLELLERAVQMKWEEYAKCVPACVSEWIEMCLLVSPCLRRLSMYVPVCLSVCRPILPAHPSIHPPLLLNPSIKRNTTKRLRPRSDILRPRAVLHATELVVAKKGTALSGTCVMDMFVCVWTCVCVYGSEGVGKCGCMPLELAVAKKGTALSGRWHTSVVW